eukprot:TRINITY_DN1247_c0_g1_i1.p1 TRINITY_DN1247_c0_g1~~TRINITY_DN1247_c0_g1_i1.p1  ORF type:complete len:2796 (+),score=837.54 TRINITY_DN1247_c0_g1_i1:511-8388(+)
MVVSFASSIGPFTSKQGYRPAGFPVVPPPEHLCETVEHARQRCLAGRSFPGFAVQGDPNGVTEPDVVAVCEAVGDLEEAEGWTVFQKVPHMHGRWCLEEAGGGVLELQQAGECLWGTFADDCGAPSDVLGAVLGSGVELTFGGGKFAGSVEPGPDMHGAYTAADGEEREMTIRLALQREAERRLRVDSVDEIYQNDDHTISVRYSALPSDPRVDAHKDPMKPRNDFRRFTLDAPCDVATRVVAMEGMQSGQAFAASDVVDPSVQGAALDVAGLITDWAEELCRKYGAGSTQLGNSKNRTFQSAAVTSGTLQPSPPRKTAPAKPRKRREAAPQADEERRTLARMNAAVNHLLNPRSLPPGSIGGIQPARVAEAQLRQNRCDSAKGTPLTLVKAHPPRMRRAVASNAEAVADVGAADAILVADPCHVVFTRFDAGEVHECNLVLTNKDRVSRRVNVIPPTPEPLDEPVHGLVVCAAEDITAHSRVPGSDGAEIPPELVCKKGTRGVCVGKETPGTVLVDWENRRAAELPPATVRPSQLEPVFMLKLLSAPSKGNMLAPGMSLRYLVRFRPRSLRTYRADAVVCTEWTRFCVPLCGERRPPELRLSVGTGPLDVGVCLVGGEVVRTVAVENAGGWARFRVSAAAPDADGDAALPPCWRVKPSEFTLDPGASTELLVWYQPSEPGQSEADVWLVGDDGTSVKLGLAGAGHFPDLVLATAGNSAVSSADISVSFDPISVHAVGQKKLVFQNRSPLSLRYRWLCEAVDDGDESAPGVFSVSPPEGVAASGVDLACDLQFNAEDVGQYRGRCVLLIDDVPRPRHSENPLRGRSAAQLPPFPTSSQDPADPFAFFQAAATVSMTPDTEDFGSYAVSVIGVLAEATPAALRLEPPAIQSRMPFCIQHAYTREVKVVNDSDTQQHFVFDPELPERTLAAQDTRSRRRLKQLARAREELKEAGIEEMDARTVARGVQLRFDPQSAVVPARGTTAVKITFTFLQMRAVDLDIECRAERAASVSLKLLASTEAPRMQVTPSLLDLQEGGVLSTSMQQWDDEGELARGGVEQRLTLTNPSDVPLAFRIYNERDLARHTTWQLSRAARHALLAGMTGLEQGDGAAAAESGDDGASDFRPNWRFSPPFDLLKPREKRDIVLRYTPPSVPGMIRDSLHVISAPPLQPCAALVEGMDSVQLRAFSDAVLKDDPIHPAAERLAEAVCILLGVPSPGHRVLLPVRSTDVAPGMRVFMTPPGATPGHDYCWCTVIGVGASSASVRWGDAPDTPTCSVPLEWWDSPAGGNARMHARASSGTLAALIDLDADAVVDHIRALDVSRRGLGVDAPLSSRSGSRRYPRLMDYDDLIHYKSDDVWCRLAAVDEDPCLTMEGVAEAARVDTDALAGARRLASWVRLVLSFIRAVRHATASVRVHAEVQKAAACVSPPQLDLGSLFQGVPAERTVTLRNLSGIDMEFLWAAVEAEGVDVEAEPGHGRLLPGQSLPVRVSVVPKRGGPLDCIVLCVVREEGTSREQHLALNVSAEEVRGLAVSAVATEEEPTLDIVADDGQSADDYCRHLVTSAVAAAVGEPEPLWVPSVEFGEVPLFGSATRYLTIRNHSGCETNFSLRCRQYQAPPSHRNDEAERLLSVGALSVSSSRSKRGRAITLGRAHEALKFTATAGQDFALKRREEEGSHHRSRAVLAGRRGCAVEASHVGGQLPGGSVMPIRLTLHNDLVGRYDDVIELTVDGAPVAQLPLSVTCAGSLVSLAPDTPGLTFGGQGETPKLVFQPQPPGSDACRKSLRCFNPCPVDMEVRWGLHSGARLVDVGLTGGGDDEVRVVLRDADPAPKAGPISVDPPAAILPARSGAVFTVSFSPTEPGDFRASLRCMARTADTRANTSWLAQLYHQTTQAADEGPADGDDDRETTPSQSTQPPSRALRRGGNGRRTIDFSLPDDDPDSSDEDLVDTVAKVAKERRNIRQVRKEAKRQEEEWIRAQYAARWGQESLLAHPIDIDVCGSAEPCVLECDPPGGVIKLPNCRGGPPPFQDPVDEGYVRWITLRNPSASALDFRLTADGPFSLSAYRFWPTDSQAPPPPVAKTRLTQGKTRPPAAAGYSGGPSAASASNKSGLQSMKAFTASALARVAEGHPPDLIEAGHHPKGRTGFGSDASKTLFRLRRDDSVEVAVQLNWSADVATQELQRTKTHSMKPAAGERTDKGRGHPASADLARVEGGLQVTFVNGERQRFDVLALVHFPAVSCVPSALVFGDRDDDRDPSWPKRIVLSSLTPAPAAFTVTHVPVTKPLSHQSAAELAAVSRLGVIEREISAQFRPTAPPKPKRFPRSGHRVLPVADADVVLRKQTGVRPLAERAAAAAAATEEQEWRLAAGTEAEIVSVHFDRISLRNAAGELSELTAATRWRYADGSLCDTDRSGPGPIDDPSVFEFAVGGVRGRVRGQLPGISTGAGERARMRRHLGATATRAMAASAKALQSHGMQPMAELSEAGLGCEEMAVDIGSGAFPMAASLHQSLGVQLTDHLVIPVDGGREAAGLRAGMRVSEVDGRAVSTMVEAHEAFAASGSVCSVVLQCPQVAETRERDVEVYFHPRGTAVFESKFRIDVAGGRGCVFTVRGVSAQTELADLVGT